MRLTRRELTLLLEAVRRQINALAGGWAPPDEDSERNSDTAILYQIKEKLENQLRGQ